MRARATWPSPNRTLRPARRKTLWHAAGLASALKIKLKRVDIVNCDAAFGNIQLFM
jgi:hypothetical protein